MDFEFNEQQKIFKQALEDVNKREIEPFLARFPEDKSLPREAQSKLLQIAKPLGLSGAQVPVEDGGSGLDMVSVGIATEIIPHEAMPSSAIPSRICAGGSDELKRRVVPPLINGEKLAGSAISEPNVGSDPRRVETEAVLVNGEYIVNGTKKWSSNGYWCDILLAMVSLGRDERGRNVLGRLVIEREVSPFQAKEIDMVGFKRNSMAEISFEDCHVPQGNLVGEPGEAHGPLTRSWLGNRPLIGLRALRFAQKALDASIEYAKQRQQFGKVIGSFQLVQEMIVEMATLIEASRLLCYKALSTLDNGVWAAKESSMAKYFATESAVRVTWLAMRVHGAQGLSRENKLEQYNRDAMMCCVPDGTIEINKLIVGRELLGISAST